MKLRVIAFVVVVVVDGEHGAKVEVQRIHRYKYFHE